MKRTKRALIAIVALVAALAIITLAYFGVYYHATDVAEKAIEGTNEMSVISIDEGYLFDGKGTEAALIFYPGAKVESDAYAPLMQRIAEQGTDCFLCRMPLNFALFDKDLACEIASEYDYDKWYLSGHSLGGATAAMLAESGEGHWDGLILLAAYPTGELQEPVLSIYGSEDKVLNMKKYSAVDDLSYWPEDMTEVVIEGGNHAGFGDYGAQKGDGEATISAEQQQQDTADAIVDFVGKH